MTIVLKATVMLLTTALILIAGIALVLAQSNSWEFDADGDGLIEISYLEQLDAVRLDLNGDGRPDSGDATAVYSYAAAFSATFCDGTCKGYELARSLDFNDADSYASGAINSQWTTGTGWYPIGYRDYVERGASNLVYLSAKDVGYAAILEGNGYTISNLHIANNTLSFVGLFATLEESSLVRHIGLLDVKLSVPERDNPGDKVIVIRAAPLAGQSIGTVFGSFSTGTVSCPDTGCAGLVGINYGLVSASYSTANVSAEYASGLVSTTSSYWRDDRGERQTTKGEISNSYASGAVSSTATDDRRGAAGGFVYKNSGLIRNSYSVGAVSGKNLEYVGGFSGYGHAINSFWDTQTSGQIFGAGTNSGQYSGLQGKTTAELQAPTGYIGIYHTWDTAGEDFWDFGTSSQYPALKIDVNGDGEATWWEFGPQIGNRPIPPPTPMPTATPTATATPPPTFTPTPAPTSKPTPIPTDTPTPEPTNTPTPIPANTPASQPSAMPEPTSAPSAEATDARAQPTNTPAPVATSAPMTTPISAPNPTAEPDEESNGGCGAPSGPVPLGITTGNLLLLIAPLGMIWGLKWRSNRKRRDEEN